MLSMTLSPSLKGLQPHQMGSLQSRFLTTGLRNRGTALALVSKIYKRLCYRAGCGYQHKKPLGFFLFLPSHFHPSAALSPSLHPHLFWGDGEHFLSRLIVSGQFPSLGPLI